MPPKKAAPAPAPAPADAAPAVIDLGPEVDLRKPKILAAFSIYDPEATGNVLVECVLHQETRRGVSCVHPLRNARSPRATFLFPFSRAETSQRS